MSFDKPLCKRLADPSRPVFLLGDVPPGEGTPPGKCQEIADKFLQRSRPLAVDGFIVYDIQDEPGRNDMDRPFPYRRVMDSSAHAALLSRSSGRECLVYKCVADANFDDWLRTAKSTHNHCAINLVGRASSGGEYVGPTILEAMQKVASEKDVDFGCVCIAERHTLESAIARGRDYPTEHVNMLRKQKEGASWFISQAVYDAEPTIRLLKDYAAVCKQAGIVPRKVVLTFAPVSRTKTMNFIKWLGVRVPPKAEERILGAEKPVEESILYQCELLRTILVETAGVGIPLGISCESVSIFKAEIDGVHELFRRLQCILLDSAGSPWKVSWIEVMPRAGIESKEQDEKQNLDLVLLQAGLMGIVIGSMTVTLGMILGTRRK